MNRSVAIASILFVGISLAPLGKHVAADEQPLFGYSAESSPAERQWEEKLRAIPSPDNLRFLHAKTLGAPAPRWLSLRQRERRNGSRKFKEFGLDTHIEQFDVLFPTPKERVVELVEGGPKFVAKLQEPALPQIPHRISKAEQLPTYNAYSIDGDVTRSSRLRQLRNPRRTITARAPGYFRCKEICHRALLPLWRGIKPRLPAEHGAIGCLIYSDPP